MKRILINIPPEPEMLRRLQSTAGVEVVLAKGTDFRKREPLPSELIRGVHILLCEYPPMNFADMASVELIQITSSGYSQLYGLGLTEKGVRACNNVGNFDVPIAEWNLAMMVNLARNLRAMIRNQETGVWYRAPEFQREIRGSVVGIWGYGGIGRETARLSKALGMVVHALSRGGVGLRPNVYSVPGTGDPEGRLPDRVFLRGQELDFLANLDFLVLTMPLTKSTEGIVGEKELRRLPTTCYILNPARGPLIQEEALLKALREGWIAGAALDTHYQNPLPADHPLWRLPNVIMTPHISGSNQSPRFLQRGWDLFMQNVRRFLTGQPLLNELTPEQLSAD